MVASNPDELEVSYTVKELLKTIRDDQQAGFGRLEKAMEAKADKADFARIEGHIEVLEKRVLAIEEGERVRRERAEVHQQRDALAAEQAQRRWSRSQFLITIGAMLMSGGIGAIASLFASGHP